MDANFESFENPVVLSVQSNIDLQAVDSPELRLLRQASSSQVPIVEEVDQLSALAPKSDPGVIADVVAGVPFGLTVTIRRLDGSVNRDYRGTVEWSSDDRTVDPAYPVMLPPRYTFTSSDQGVHSFNGFVLRTVALTGHARTLTLTGTDNLLPGSALVNMWFNAKATREGLVGGTTACGRVIKVRDHFVALPARGLCRVPILLSRTDGAGTTATKVKDVGPYFGSNARGDDPYWNTRGRPLTEIQQVGNRAGIDLADGTFLDAPPSGLGLRDNTRIYWRFM